MNFEGFSVATLKPFTMTAGEMALLLRGEMKIGFMDPGQNLKRC